MEKSTVELLIATLITSYTVAVQNKQKLQALEIALEEKQPKLYKSYCSHLETVQASAVDTPVAAFQALAEALLRD